MTRVLRTAGWVLVAAGLVILLYLFYLLFWTGRATDRAQRELLETWTLEYGALPDEGAAPAPTAAPSELPEVDPGQAYAAIWFERPGSDERPVTDGVLFVVEGVTLDHLTRGPGHYPETAPPGGQGNFAVSGHRTTYSAPFYHLDQLREGDEVHVVDRAAREWVYVVRESTVVQPTDLWVVEPDPLDTGRPTMTLTTCHPRFSAAQRYITFAELVGEPRAA